MDLDGLSDSEIHRELSDLVGSDVRMDMSTVRTSLMTNQPHEELFVIGATLAEAVPKVTDSERLSLLFSEAQCPFVCHNGLFDILHLHHNFIAPIPEDRHDLCLPFPIYDTKLILDQTTLPQLKFDRTTLDHAYENCDDLSSQLVKWDIPTKSHTAGYDSYMIVALMRKILSEHGSLNELASFKNKCYIRDLATGLEFNSL